MRMVENVKTQSICWVTQQILLGFHFKLQFK